MQAITKQTIYLPHDGKRKKPSYSRHISMPVCGGFDFRAAVFLLFNNPNHQSNYGGI